MKKQIYHRNGKKAILDQCRKILIPFGPEEEVRQNYIDDFVKTMEIPLNCLDTEVNLSNWKKGARGRVDILVKANSSGNPIPLLAFEVKSSSKELNSFHLEQVLRYQNVLKCPFVGIGNGNFHRLYKIENNDPIEIKTDITYNDLLKEKNLEPIPAISFEKLTLEVLLDTEYMQYLYDDIVLSPVTEERFKPVISIYENFLMAGTFSKDIFTKYGIELLDDLGVSDRSYENHAGGSWYGIYRGLLVKDFQGQHQIIRFSILASITSTDHPRFGNRKGGTYLVVSIDDFDLKPHLSLEYCFDRYIHLEHEKCHLYHDGRLTYGQFGAVKIDTTMQYMAKHSIGLLNTNKSFINLGEFPINEIDEYALQDSIARFSAYSFLRDNLRKELKNKKIK